jgi:hypothetical protein
MTQGYVLFGVDDPGATVNITHAYALVCSLKRADPKRKTCVVVQEHAIIPPSYEDVFDYIITLPFGRTDNNHHNMYLDFWQLYHCTPFDETIFIDTYSVAIDNISSLWDISGIDDMVFATATDFRNDPPPPSMFSSQESNNILAFSTGMMYFIKTAETLEFFKMADVVFKHWRHFYQELIIKNKPNDFDLDLMVNIVYHLLGIKPSTFMHFDYTDLRYNDSTYDWTQTLNIWVTDQLQIKINNYRQTGVMRYAHKSFLTTEILKKIESASKKKISIT